VKAQQRQRQVGWLSSSEVTGSAVAAATAGAAEVDSAAVVLAGVAALAVAIGSAAAAVGAGGSVVVVASAVAVGVSAAAGADTASRREPATRSRRFAASSPPGRKLLALPSRSPSRSAAARAARSIRR
jgi:hypothetical protein